MTEIKICGLTRPADIVAANAARPEYAGFILAPGRRRTVTPEQVRALRTSLLPGIRAVGVFVDAAPQAVAALLNDGTIDIAQLHGQEDTAYLSALRGMTERPVWKAFQLGGGGHDLRQIADFPADRLLLDSGAGSGKPFDWAMLEAFDRPYILAGGLTPDNVADALRRCRPAAVDVSSGVETDGYKDARKIQQFVHAVRSV